MLSGSSTKIKTIGRTPRTVGPLTPEVTLSPTCAEPVGFLEKFKCIGELKSKGDNNLKNNYSKFAMESMLNTLLADDMDEEIQEDCDKVVRRINFDADSIEGKGEEKSEQPEYILKISEALDIFELQASLRQEAYCNQMQADYNENIRMGELVREIETKITPALDKLAKDPVRIHEIMKQESEAEGIHCEVENHENFICAVSSLSQDSKELLEFSSVNFDYGSELENLESIADDLDVKLSSRAAEKLKQNKLMKIVQDLKRKNE